MDNQGALLSYEKRMYICVQAIATFVLTTQKGMRFVLKRFHIL